MSFVFVWESAVIVVTAIFLLRISGRKSLSQMSIGTTVVMLSIGAAMVGPIVDKGLGKTIGAIVVFVVVLILVEYLQLKFSFAERLISGRPLLVVENGKVNQKNLRKLRISDPKLAMRFRQIGMDNIDDIKSAYIETNGELGYVLKEEAKPLTKRDLENILPSLRLQMGAQANMQGHKKTP